VAFLLVALISARASGEDDFSHIRLKLGDTVYVTTGGGVIKGIVSNLSASVVKVVRTAGLGGCDVMVLEDGEPLFSRRCVDEKGARFVTGRVVLPPLKHTIGRKKG